MSQGSAAAFVDAEARLFLADEPIGPGDRVLAGLSVAFDASCEEMWPAWGHGACLVPAPRAGADRRRPGGRRLLIFGGEACPPELAARVAVESREVWNTYGPTEATVVACAAPLTGTGPVRIGLPLDGWTLAVVDAAGMPVGMGEHSTPTSPHRPVPALRRPASADGSRAAVHDLGRHPSMMDMLAGMFGPYPFADHQVVVADDVLDVPIEAQGMSVFGANHVDDRRTHERLVLHELAHQCSATASGWRTGATSGSTRVCDLRRVAVVGGLRGPPRRVPRP